MTDAINTRQRRLGGHRRRDRRLRRAHDAEGPEHLLEPAWIAADHDPPDQAAGLSRVPPGDAAGVVGRGDPRPRRRALDGARCQPVVLGRREPLGHGAASRDERHRRQRPRRHHHQLLRRPVEQQPASDVAGLARHVHPGGRAGIGVYFSSGDEGDNIATQGYRTTELPAVRSRSSPPSAARALRWAPPTPTCSRPAGARRCRPARRRVGPARPGTTAAAAARAASSPSPDTSRAWCPRTSPATSVGGVAWCPTSRRTATPARAAGRRNPTFPAALSATASTGSAAPACRRRCSPG